MLFGLSVVTIIFTPLKSFLLNRWWLQLSQIWIEHESEIYIKCECIQLEQRVE